MNKSDVKRFWKRVEKTKTAPRCWLWTGGCCSSGYGTIKVCGRVIGTHRLSWLIHHGVIPEGLCVLHKCDVPACIRPSHLFLGTKGDNVRDMEAKGRRTPVSGERHRLIHNNYEAVRGERNGRARLTPAQVLAIRAQHQQKKTVVEIARAYAMSEAGIRHIIKRRSWVDVKEED